MTFEEFQKNLEELFDKKGKFNKDTNLYNSIDINSFNQLLYITFINEEFGVNMKVGDLNPDETIEQTYNRIILLVK